MPSVKLFLKVQSCAPCRIPSRGTWLESEKATNANGHLTALPGARDTMHYLLEGCCSVRAFALWMFKACQWVEHKKTHDGWKPSWFKIPVVSSIKGQNTVKWRYQKAKSATVSIVKYVVTLVYPSHANSAYEGVVQKEFSGTWYNRVNVNCPPLNVLQVFLN